MDLDRTITHWALGVVTSAEPDDDNIVNALTRADNVQMISVAGEKQQPSTRPTLSLTNSTQLSGGVAIVGGIAYPYLAAGVTTNYLVVVSRNGDVHLLTDDGITTTLTPIITFAGALTSSLTNLDAAIMNNRVFLQDGEGSRTSLKGTDRVDWGVSPVTGLALATTGVGVMNGDYEVRVTGWNDQISAESDISSIVSITGLVNQQLRITVNSVAVGLTHRYFRVYLRKASLGSGFFRVQAGTGYVGGTVDGFPLFSGGATVTTDINVSDATLVASVLTPPAINAHGLPPTGSLFVALYERRLFVADQDKVYWSELDKPDAFNPLSNEPIRSRDPRGGSVTGLKVFGGQLHVFTETARITLTGRADTRTWQWETADEIVGAVSNRSIVVVPTKLMAWWDKELGPVVLLGDGSRVDIGFEFIRPNVVTSRVNTSRFYEITAAADSERVLFAYPEVGKSRLTRMLSFNLLSKKWESTRWDPMDPAALIVGLDTNDKQSLYLGSYVGQLFRFATTSNAVIDGVRTGTFTGTVTLAAGSHLTITDLTATFDTTGGALRERKITILDADGDPVTGTYRPYIVSNTGTVLTLNDSVVINAAGTYTYIIGGPDVVIETFWDHMGQPFLRKRHDRLWLDFRSGATPASVRIGVAVNSDETQVVYTSVVESESSLWDQAFWDVAFWDQLDQAVYRKSIVKSGRNYRIQIRSPYPNQSFTLLKIRMQAHAKTDRYTRGY